MGGLDEQGEAAKPEVTKPITLAREIKLRAWDKEGDEMIFPDDDNGEGYPYEFFITKHGLSVSSWRDGKVEVVGHGDTREYGGPTLQDVIIMQYTGFKDCDGKEIFEGDILHCDHRMEDNPPLAEVVWDADEGCWGYEKHTYYLDGEEVETGELAFLLADYEYSRLYGNVHEHPTRLAEYGVTTATSPDSNPPQA